MKRRRSVRRWRWRRWRRWRWKKRIECGEGGESETKWMNSLTTRKWKKRKSCGGASYVENAPVYLLTAVVEKMMRRMSD